MAALGELEKETVFIDGTKLESCANKYTFVWRKWEEKMFCKIEEAFQMLNQEYVQTFSVRKECRTEELQKVSDYLEGGCKEKQTVFVHGRGK